MKNLIIKLANVLTTSYAPQLVFALDLLDPVLHILVKIVSIHVLLVYGNLFAQSAG